MMGFILLAISLLMIVAVRMLQKKGGATHEHEEAGEFLTCIFIWQTQRSLRPYGSAVVILFIVGLLFLLLEKGLPQLSWDFLMGLLSEIEEGGGIGRCLIRSMRCSFPS